MEKIFLLSLSLKINSPTLCFSLGCMFSSFPQYTHSFPPFHPFLIRLSLVKMLLLVTNQKNILILAGIFIFHRNLCGNPTPSLIRKEYKDLTKNFLFLVSIQRGWSGEPDRRTGSTILTSYPHLTNAFSETHLLNVNRSSPSTQTCARVASCCWQIL